MSTSNNTMSTERSGKSAYVGRGRFAVHVLVITALAHVIMGDRIVLSFTTGGRGQLSLTTLMFALVVGAILVFHTGSGLNFCARPHLWLCWGFYLTLSLSLPAFGIAFNDFPARTIAGMQEVFLALGFLFAGSWLRSRPECNSLLKRYFLLAVSFQAVLAIIQMAAIIPGLSSSWLVSIIHEWDVISKTNLNSEAIVTARATGAYLNPNALGFYAATSFWASALFLKGLAQKYALAVCLLTLILSISRGSIVAMVISGMIFILLQVLNRRNGSLRGESKTVLLALAVAAIMGIAVSVVDASDSLGLNDRLPAIANVMFNGTDEGGNYDARAEVWTRVLSYCADHPFGTGGPPQLKSHESLDNQYINTIMQGGVAYLSALLLMIAGGLRLFLQGDVVGIFIAVISLAIGVNSVTMLPLGIVAIGVYWAALGYYFGK
jgi:hypothetical protein